MERGCISGHKDRVRLYLQCILVHFTHTLTKSLNMHDTQKNRRYLQYKTTINVNKCVATLFPAAGLIKI